MTEEAFVYGFVFAVGAVCGSFANVCIHRLPKGKSVVFPGSHCPACGNAIAFYDNVPVLSWLLLRARCRRCRAPIPARYVLVELTSGLLFVASLWRFGPTPAAAAVALLSLAVIVLVLTDLAERILPDEVTLGGVLIGLGIAAGRDLLAEGAPFADGFLSSALFRSAAGAALGAGLLLAVRAAYQKLRKVEGMGLGDVKMLAMAGAFLGPSGVLLTILLASVSGSLAGGLAAGLRRARWEFAARSVRREPETAASVAARTGALVGADGKVLSVARRWSEVPGAAGPGERADRSSGAARPLAVFYRLARRGARTGKETATGRLFVEDEVTGFFRVLAVRAVPVREEVLLLAGRVDVPFGVFLGAGILLSAWAGDDLGRILWALGLGPS